jgi:hypothetical protein
VRLSHQYDHRNTWIIEEGRAVSKSPHYNFGYFLSISQQAVSANIRPPPHLFVLTEPVFWQKSPAGTGKQTAKTWFGLEK